ncbi:MAG: flagellar type III secretion system pore protein FliP [Candidatus Calescibacterium sp.]|nr:flagellar type III secretion system pore protein FliP [Candidatus Calescibacterium sp.]MCX7972453.1 flagellar type III secretion system pore protein FliP [bacterium]MDW8195656.1 flagellar type III secretion system pore protein FliP [Candidatus Calescibacterium sp.]
MKFFCIYFLLMMLLGLVWAADIPKIDLPNVSIQFKDTKSTDALAAPLKALGLITVLSLAPYIIIMMTPYIRVVIVFSMLRSAMGTQQTPPNQVIIAFSFFVTLYILNPVLTEINEKALQPYLKRQITQEQFIQISSNIYKRFMYKHTKPEDLAFFIQYAKIKKPEKPEDIPLQVLIPAYLLSELKAAFIIGFLIYLPFLVIDMIVGSVLMAMGMFMMSPMVVSLPFKLLLFVSIDGWKLITEGLIKSYR